MEQNTYRYLEALKGSDYQIVDGEPNIIGWNVKSESDTSVGKITDLLFDPQTQAVRYLIVNLEGNGMNLDDKKVMIPIGIAHLHTTDDEVILPNVHLDQFNALPAYEDGKIGPETEVRIRSVIGSPAALRIEDTTTAFDQDQFYNHQHFDKQRFYHRGGISNAGSMPGMGERLTPGMEGQTGAGMPHNEPHSNKPWLNDDGTPKLHPDEPREKRDNDYPDSDRL